MINLITYKVMVIFAEIIMLYMLKMVGVGLHPFKTGPLFKNAYNC